MKIVVAHNTTQERAIALVDQSADGLFDFGSTAGSAVLVAPAALREAAARSLK